MEKSSSSPCPPLAFAIALTLIITRVNGQSSSICTGAMIQSFNPCISFFSTSSNSSSPTSDCCNSLRNLMSNGQDCLCLIVTGGVPLRIPINRPLAMSLPRACKMSGVPIECKATASPVPAPDPQNPGKGSTSMSPELSPPSPRAPFVPQLSPPSMAPEGDIVPTLTPPGMRPTLIPSAAYSSHCALLSAFSILGVVAIYMLRIL